MIAGKMKLLSAVVSAAALLATPALASKAHKKKVSGHDVHARDLLVGRQIPRLGPRPEHSLSVDAGPKPTKRLIPKVSTLEGVGRKLM